MQTTDIYLLISTLLLGIRHGIDWDHIAAILDLAGVGAVDAQGTIAATQFNGQSIRLASLYALGHALVVVALGVAIRCLAAALPPWLDSVMERVVGGTLIIFGIWIVILMILALREKRAPRFESRAALLGAGLRRAVNFILRRNSEDGVSSRSTARVTAFTIGMIHGIGAETSTQIVLIASLAAASSIALVAFLLLSFVGGLLISSCVVAACAAGGFLAAARVRHLYTGLGIVASAFSVYVGFCLFFGVEHGLPSLLPVINVLHFPGDQLSYLR